MREGGLTVHLLKPYADPHHFACGKDDHLGVQHFHLPHGRGGSMIEGMTGGQLAYLCVLTAGVAMLLLGFFTRKVIPTFMGGALIIMCIGIAIMPDGSMWMQP